MLLRDRACALGEALLGPWSGAPSVPPWLRRVPLPGIGERIRIEDPHGALVLIRNRAKGVCEILAGQSPELDRIALLDDHDARRLGALLLAAHLAGV